MPTVESSIRIGVPPDEVTRILLDADLAPQWTAGLERLELTERELGQAGSVGHAHYLEGGSLRWVGKGTNPLTRVALTLMKRQITRRTESDLRSLRDLAEQG